MREVHGPHAWSEGGVRREGGARGKVQQVGTRVTMRAPSPSRVWSEGGAQCVGTCAASEDAYSEGDMWSEW